MLVSRVFIFGSSTAKRIESYSSNAGYQQKLIHFFTDGERKEMRVCIGCNKVTQMVIFCYSQIWAQEFVVEN